MDYFSQYITEDFTAYINRKRNDHCMGNHTEMQAMAEMFNRNIEVYQYNSGVCDVCVCVCVCFLCVSV